MQTIVFGPIISRRFGYSLGIDLSPSKKQCNFDCLYCELHKAKTQDSMQEIISLQSIIESIQQYLKNHKEQKIDVLTFTANGEPTLYPYLYELIKEVKVFLPPYIKTLILSNGSLFWQENVRKALMEFDIVKFSLDSINERIFKRIDRPHKNLNIETIKTGIIEFAKNFNGQLIGEILLLKGINDTQEQAKELAHFLRHIPIARLDIGTLDRPPAHKAIPLTQEEIQLFASHFSGLCVYIPKRTYISSTQKRTLNKKALLQAISMRPLTLEDMQTLFCDTTIALAHKLVDSHLLTWKKVGNIEFLCVLDSKDSLIY